MTRKKIKERYNLFHFLRLIINFGKFLIFNLKKLLTIEFLFLRSLMDPKDIEGMKNQYN